MGSVSMSKYTPHISTSEKKENLRSDPSKESVPGTYTLETEQALPSENLSTKSCSTRSRVSESFGYSSSRAKGYIDTPSGKLCVGDFTDVDDLDRDIAELILGYITPIPEIAARRLALDAVPYPIKKAIMLGVLALEGYHRRYKE